MKTAIAALATLVLAGSAAYTVDAARLNAPKVAPLSTWRELRTPHQIWPYDGAIYYSFAVNGGSRAHLIVVDTRTGRWLIRPALAQPTTAPTAEIALREGASAAVNGGYFNLKDAGMSTSFVTVDGSVVADPNNNKLLVENPKLKSFLPQILNRTEVRFLEDAGGKRTIQFAKHNAPVPSGKRIAHALQAGPRLLPTIDSVDEAFVRIDPSGTTTDSINSRKPAARTAFGVTPDGYAMFLTVSGNGQEPESSGITLEQLSSILKNLGCSDAVNLDGGASTTMYARIGTAGMGPDAAPAGSVVCGKTPETRVKSILMLLPANLRKVDGNSASRHR